MAYGKNKDRKDWLMRANPLSVGSISPAKHQRIMVLRGSVLELMRQMATQAFDAEPLRSTTSSKDLEIKLIDLQKSAAGLNAVWAEQARMRVKPALEESNKRYFARLAGALRFVDQKIPASEELSINCLKFIGPPRPVKRYFHVPVDLQDHVTIAELDGLKSIAQAGHCIDAFRDLIVHGSTSCWSATQTAILRDIHARALVKHSAPDFGNGDDFTLQLHIDYRMLPSSDKKSPLALDLRRGSGTLLVDEGNRKYHRFLDLSGVVPREERIRIPLAISRKMAQRLLKTNNTWASLILEISQDHLGVRLVAGMAPQEKPTAVNTFVGRDFGYANTVSLSVAVGPDLQDLDQFQTHIDKLTSQASVKAFLSAHQVDANINIVERVRFEGRAFLKRIKTLCDRIDGFKSRIDLKYNDLNCLRATIAFEMALKDGEFITPEMKKQHPQVRAFFVLMGQINELKAARRGDYRRIVALKKAWFGMLANVEIALAQKYNAAIVREDLTVEAIEKTKPDYKGRLFNKMINNGSKGQYQKRATDKMQWNGVPELVVPSWYTSRVCVRHSVIAEKSQRKGEKIFLKCCGHHDHADEHASDSIASYPFLRPKVNPSPQGQGICETQTI